MGSLGSLTCPGMRAVKQHPVQLTVTHIILENKYIKYIYACTSSCAFPAGRSNPAAPSCCPCGLPVTKGRVALPRAARQPPHEPNGSSPARRTQALPARRFTAPRRTRFPRSPLPSTEQPRRLQAAPLTPRPSSASGPPRSPPPAAPAPGPAPRPADSTGPAHSRRRARFRVRPREAPARCRRAGRGRHRLQPRPGLRLAGLCGSGARGGGVESVQQRPGEGGAGSPFSACCQCCAWKGRRSVSLPRSRSMVLAPGQLGSHRDPPVFLSQTAVCAGTLLLPRGRSLHLLNFISIDYSSSPVRQRNATPASVGTTPLVKVLTRTSFIPWVHRCWPPIRFLPLITALWAFSSLRCPPIQPIYQQLL